MDNYPAPKFTVGAQVHAPGYGVSVVEGLAWISVGQKSQVKDGWQYVLRVNGRPMRFREQELRAVDLFGYASEHDLRVEAERAWAE